MRRLDLVLLFGLFCAPGWALAQSATLAVPTPPMRMQAKQLLDQCVSSERFAEYLSALCFVQYVNAGGDALKRQNWNQAIMEESAAIVILVTYRQSLFGSAPQQLPSEADNKVAAYLNRSIAYIETKQYDLAMSDDTAALDFDPENLDARNNRCWQYAVIGQLSNALLDCKIALQRAPRSPNVLDSTGFVYLKMKNYPAAIASYDSALESNPKLASSLYGMGLAEQAQGYQAKAVQEIAAAKQLDPNITRDFGSFSNDFGN